METQKTIQNPVHFSGKGLFLGKEVSLSLLPAKEDSGIVFVRKDLSGKPSFVAHLDKVKGTPRCTILGSDLFSVRTVEHLLSALYAYGIDNLIVEITEEELPIGDGSANFYVEALEKATIVSLSKKKKPLIITNPLYWTDKDISFLALPAEKFIVTYGLQFPSYPTQCYTASVQAKEYKEMIAPARTFAFYEEIAPFIEKGIRGGGLENALVIKNGTVMNPEGTRFSDEMARHKVLDLIGDLSLIGRPIVGHIIAMRSGHSSNIAFAKYLISMELANG